VYGANVFRAGIKVLGPRETGIKAVLAGPIKSKIFSLYKEGFWIQHGLAHSYFQVLITYTFSGLSFRDDPMFYLTGKMPLPPCKQIKYSLRHY
jgi:hypothetical protein